MSSIQQTFRMLQQAYGEYVLPQLTAIWWFNCLRGGLCFNHKPGSLGTPAIAVNEIMRFMINTADSLFGKIGEHLTDPTVVCSLFCMLT